jgi:serine/threonine-protein kinase
VTAGRISAETIVDGRYRIVERIGSGGMADVYCADDLQLGRRVALKLLHPRFAEDREFRERFRREASAAAGLQHQNVVSIYDRGEWDGTSYIAMEYVSGRTLKQIVQEEAPLEPARAIDLVVQVLRAARFAHRRGIVHRDLKPQNVIVEDAGPSHPTPTAKVADFGIARAGASDMTETGSIMGTAQYLSPEQAQGVAVDERADLYAVGIILYELLTGRVPFEGESPVTIALKQVNEHPVPPSSYNRAVSPELDAVVLRALEKDPQRRPADADEMIALLEAARPHAGATAATALAPPTGPMPPVALEPEPELDEDRRGRRWWWALGILAIVAAIVAAVLLLRPDTVTVPTVVGADQAAAETRLRQEGFQVESVARNSERPKGEVLGQDPQGGEEAEEGSTVTLTVSDGPEQRPVPSVVGLTYRSAARRLRSAGFAVRRRDEASTSVEEGRVISSSPAEGTQADRGQEVTLVVSTGPEQAAVPSVVGQSEDDARATLQGAGFNVSVTREESADEDPGTVLRQSPAGGEQAEEGSTVALVVAREPEEAEVPDVTGETRDVAVARLSGDGFEVRIRERVVDSPEGDGVVIEQDPSGGRAEQGSRVTITVGVYEAGSPEPEPGTGGTTPEPGSPGADGAATVPGADAAP